MNQIVEDPGGNRYDIGVRHKPGIFEQAGVPSLGHGAKWYLKWRCDPQPSGRALLPKSMAPELRSKYRGWNFLDQRTWRRLPSKVRSKYMNEETTLAAVASFTKKKGPFSKSYFA